MNKSLYVNSKPSDGNVEIQNAVSETESNNTYTTANQIWHDDDNYGVISSTTDVDWYKVKFTASGNANFWLGNIPINTNYDLYLYNSSGSTELKRSTLGGNATELISGYAVTANTLYYLKVISSSGSNMYNSYNLRVKNYPSTIPDLLITNVTWSPASPIQNQQVTFSATVKNQGTVATNKNTRVLFKVAGVAVSTAETTSFISVGGSTTINGATKWSATTGTHLFSALADDTRLMDENSESNNEYSTNITVAADTGAPSAPTTLTTSNLTATGVTLAWSGATDNVGVTGYEVYRGSTLLTTQTGTSYTYSGLSGGTTYVLGIFAKDAVGNKSSKATKSIMTPGTTKPSTPGAPVYSSLGSTSVTISWTASTDNVGVTGYKLYRNNSLITTVTGTSYTNTGLTASTTYQYYVIAKDAAGNVSTASPTTNVTTPTGTETTPPTTPGAPAYSSITSNSVVISWSASTDASGISGYDLYRNGTLLTTVTTNTYTNTGLTSSTTYSYYVRARDTKNNVSAASTTTSVTKTDITPPTTPGSPIYTSVTSSSVVISWTASTDASGISGYDLYRNGTLLTTVTSNTYTNTGLTASTTYNYYVKAKDTKNNVSAASSTTSVTTLAATPTGDSYEENGTVATAKTMSLNTTITPTLHATSDVDYFKFALSSQSNVTITLTSPTGCDYDMTSYDVSTGTVEIAALCLGSETSPEGKTTILDSGTYCVKVFSYSGSSATSTYSLKLDAVRTVGDLYESNDTVATAMTIATTNTTITPTIHNSADVDYFKFVLSGQSNTTITLTSPTNCDYDADVFDSTGTTLVSALQLNSDKSPESKTATLNVGTYYIKVFGFLRSCSASPYSLNVNAGGDTQPPSTPSGVNTTGLNSSSMNIVWNASSDNVGIKEYQVFRNNVKIGSTTTTTYYDGTLTQGTLYEYYVIAVDASNNTSVASSKIDRITSSANLEVGLRAFGITPTDSVAVDGEIYTYMALFGERPELKLNYNSPKVGLLKKVLDNMGASLKLNDTLNTYNLRTVAAQRALAVRTGIADAGAMDALTWAKLRQEIQNQAGNTNVQPYKDLFYAEFENQMRRLFLESVGLYAPSADINHMLNVALKRTYSPASPGSYDIQMIQVIFRALGMTIADIDSRRGMYENWQTNCAAQAMQYQAGTNPVSDSDWDNLTMADWGYIFNNVFTVYLEGNDTTRNTIRTALINKQNERINVYSGRLQPALQPSSTQTGTLTITATAQDASRIRLEVWENNNLVWNNGVSAPTWSPMSVTNTTIEVQAQSVVDSVYKESSLEVRTISSEPENTVSEIAPSETSEVSKVQNTVNKTVTNEARDENISSLSMLNTDIIYGEVQIFAKELPKSVINEVYDEVTTNQETATLQSNSIVETMGAVTVNGSVVLSRGTYNVRAIAVKEFTQEVYTRTTSQNVFIDGTGNIAMNKTGYASSAQPNSTFVIQNAFDGNAATRWSSEYLDPQWIYVDLGSSQNVGRVRLNWEAAFGKTYKIQVSNDASNWTGVYSTSSGDGGLDDISFNTVSARYVRMYGTARGTQWGYSLYDFEVYGTGNPDYSINGMANNLQRLVDLATSYKQSIITDYSVNELALQYVRRGSRYTNGNWPQVAGQIDYFSDYVTRNNSDLESYFNDSAILKDPLTQNNIDFVHWAATLNAHIYSTSWTDGSTLKELFQDQFIPEGVIDDLSGWAGDLQTLVADTIKYTNNSSDYTVLYNKATEYMGTTNSNLPSEFPIDDVLADTDAFNIYNKLSTSTLVSAFRNYYSIGYNKRYTDFSVNETKDVIRTCAGVYTDDYFLIDVKLLKWPLFKEDKIDVDGDGITKEPIEVSDVQSNAVRDAFADFIWNKIQGEN